MSGSPTKPQLLMALAGIVLVAMGVAGVRLVWISFTTFGGFSYVDHKEYTARAGDYLAETFWGEERRWISYEIYRGNKTVFEGRFAAEGHCRNGTVTWEVSDDPVAVHTVTFDCGPVLVLKSTDLDHWSHEL